MLPEQYENDQQRLELLDCLLEYSMEAFLCISSQWRVLAVNRQAETVFRKTRTELLGRTLWDALPTIATSLFSLRAQEALLQHNSLKYTAFSSTLNAWFAIRLYPTGTGLAVFMQEITERKRAEEEKQVSDSLAQAILDSIDVMMAVLDPDGTICLVNEAWRRRAQANCTPDQLERTGIGINYLQVCRQAQGVCTEKAPEALEGIQAVLQGRQPAFTLEYPCFSPTQHNWYLLSATPLPQNRGAVTAHIDITERKLLDEQKDLFLGMTSHELKTPLVTLRGTIQWVQRRLNRMLTTTDQLSAAWSTFAHDLSKDLADAVHHIDVQTRLINELLDISRITAHTLELSLHPCDLVSIVRATAEDLRVTAPERVLLLELPEQTVVNVLADRDRISQVITNYGTNALRYASPSQPIVIGLTVQQGTARVWVRDKGPGLTEEEKTHIWQPYHQVKGVPVQSGEGEGLGLGLAICQTLIAQHQGACGVESTPGEGSTFWFTLPMVSTRANSNG